MIRDQVLGTATNIRSFASASTLESLLPPSIYSTLVWARDTIPRGLGFSGRIGHLTGVIGLTIVMILASGFLLTVAALVFLIIMLPIALLRFIPAVDARWPWSSSDWPFWEVRT